MRPFNFTEIIKEAWKNYNPKKKIKLICDISAKVSTNHVFQIKLENGDSVIAKLSYFGNFEHFKEDHTIINALATNLLAPYEKLIARSLTKKHEVYTYRYADDLMDAWVVFYNPVPVKKKAPKILNKTQIAKLGSEIAHFHKACNELTDTLPSSSKTLQTDILHLLEILDSNMGLFAYHIDKDETKRQCDIFLHNIEKIDYKNFDIIPVFVDWNIGNFSVNKHFNLYSRWDYDWFRMAPRVMDFYFLSRVCSAVGDRANFSYYINPLMEDRFIIFLKAYHKVFPINEHKVRFMQEAYRFFILNYVIKYGHYFFHEFYASKLQREAYETYFPSIETDFDPDRILKNLNS